MDGIEAEIKPVLTMENIHKSFPGVYALKGVSLNVKPGEVLGLVGENGAGKSTLMKVLGGVVEKDHGTISLNGKELINHTPQIARSEGIAFVHQELNTADSVSIAENIFLGNLPMKGKLLKTVDYTEMYDDADNLLKKIGIELNVKKPAVTLSTAQKQMVEIAKAISKEVKVLILDEPTTSLSDKDVERLFKVIKRLQKDGVAIIYISHRMKEIFEICNKVTVLRDGEYIDSKYINEIEEQDLIRMMVGRKLSSMYPKRMASVGDKLLEVKNLQDYNNRVKEVSFHVNKGEVLGFSGLVGSGRTETMRLLFGADPMKEGEIILNGNKISINSPQNAISHGICLLTEDRKNEGILPVLSIENNISITKLDNPILDLQFLEKNAKKYCSDLDVKAPNIRSLIGNLSGGNQQKVIIGKWLNRNADILIFDEPTKGIDVGTKNAIYKIINSLVESGKTVVMISSEMPELLGMCDRLYVLCEGRITGELKQDEFDQEKIMYLSTLGGKI